MEEILLKFMKHNQKETNINVNILLRAPDLWESTEIALFHNIMSYASISNHFRLCFMIFERGFAECRISPVILPLTACSSVSSSRLSNLISCLKKKML